MLLGIDMSSHKYVVVYTTRPNKMKYTYIHVVCLFVRLVWSANKHKFKKTRLARIEYSTHT